MDDTLFPERSYDLFHCLSRPLRLHPRDADAGGAGRGAVHVGAGLSLHRYENGQRWTGRKKEDTPIAKHTHTHFLKKKSSKFEATDFGGETPPADSRRLQPAV